MWVAGKSVPEGNIEGESIGKRYEAWDEKEFIVCGRNWNEATGWVVEWKKAIEHEVIEMGRDSVMQAMEWNLDVSQCSGLSLKNFKQNFR